MVRRYNSYRRRNYGRRRYASAYLRGVRAAKQLSDLRETQAAVRNRVQATLGPLGSEHSVGYWGSDYQHANRRQRVYRKYLNFKGRGVYWPAVKAAADIAGPYLVRAAKKRGGIIGKIGSGVGKLFGWGAYSQSPEVQTNQLVEVSGGDLDMPRNQSISVNADEHTGDVVISHTEFVQNITAEVTTETSSPFKVQEFPINPGLAGTFPFLSQIAQNYTMYQFEGLMFQYKPTSGESGNASNALGKVLLSTDYDPSAAPYINSIQMANADYAQSTKPSCGAVHGVETAPQQQAMKMSYIRTGTSARDKIFTDVGLFQIASEGIPFSQGAPPTAQTTQLGELWVTYKVRLSRANLYSSLLGNNIGMAHASLGFNVGPAWITNLYVKPESNIPLTFVRSTMVTPVLIPQTQTAGSFVAGSSMPALRVLFPQNISLGYYRVLVTFNTTSSSALSSQPYPYDSGFLKWYRVGTDVSSTAYDRMLAPATVAGADLRTGVHFVNYPGAGQTQVSPATNALVMYVQINAPGVNQAFIDLCIDGTSSANVSGTFTVDVTQVNSGSAAITAPTVITSI